MKYPASILILSVMFLSQPILASEQAVTLSVENMTCVSCPYIVKKSLENVPGVKRVSVSLDEKTTTVTFDDEQANVAQLIAATTELGYPSKVTE